MQYCYHKTFGIGRILNINLNTTMFDVFFKRFGKKTIMKSFLELIPCEIVSFLLEEKYLSLFTNDKISYYKRKFPEAYSYANKEFIINFSKEKTVKIKENLLEYDLENTNDEDLYNAYLFLKGLFSNFDIMEQNNNSLLYLLQADDNNVLGSLSPNLLKVLIYFLKSEDYYFLICLMKKIAIYRKTFEEFLKAFVFSRAARALFTLPFVTSLRFLDALGVETMYHKYSKLAAYFEENDRVSDNLSYQAMQYSFYNFDYQMALEIFFDHKAGNNAFELAKNIIDEKLVDTNYYPSIMKNATIFDEEHNRLLMTLFELLTEEEKKGLISSKSYHGPIPDSYLMLSDKAAIVDKAVLGNLTALALIVENKDLFTNEEILKVINANLYDAFRNDAQPSKLLGLSTILRGLPNAYYLNEFLNNLARYRYSVELKDVYGELLQKDPESYLIKPINEEALFTYFEIRLAGICYSEKEYIINYELGLKNGILALGITFDESGNMTCNTNYMPNGFKEYLINYIQGSFSNKLASLKTTLQEEMVHKAKLLKQQKFDEFITVFKEETNELILRDDCKMRLELAFKEDDYDDSYYLKMRVGNNKLYNISNLKNFLEAFKTKEKIKYGKMLTLKHDVINFKAPYDEVINYLMPMAANFMITAGYGVAINPSLLNRLFELLKGEKIIYNDKEYLLTNTLYKVVPYIDENFMLGLKVNEPLRLIEIADNLYIFDDGDYSIKKVSGDKREIALIKFFAKAKGCSIKENLMRFKLEVLTKGEDLIEIADKIKDSLKISKLKIEAFFDYQNGQILKKERLYRDDIPIDLAKLASVEEKEYRLYNEYMESLGFQNNILNKDDALSFLAMDFTQLRAFCDVYLSEAIKAMQIKRFAPPTLIIKNDSGLMECFLEPTTYSDEELKAIYQSLMKKQKYVLLKNNTILDLNSEKATDWCELLSDIKLDVNNFKMRKALPIYEAICAYAHLNNILADDYLKMMIDELVNFKKLPYDLPAINATLRPYQKEAFNWLSILTKYHMGGILADDMGLGKTLEMISLISSDSFSKASLIVCPKSLIFNWVNEFSVFAPNIKVKKIYGTTLERLETINNIKKDEKVIYLTSYDSLRNDIDKYEDVHFRFVILDEAQYIKNVYAGKSQAVKRLVGEVRFALTGTPIENNIIDLWSIFEFIMPGFFTNLNEFKHEYENNADYPRIVSRKIAPFVLRRTKDKVLNDLPEKYTTIQEALMTDNQRKIYEAILHEAQEALAKGSKSFEMLPYLMRLRQVCVDPRLINQNYPNESGKMLLLENIIMDKLNEGHKLLIFSQFVQGLNLIIDYLKENNIAYYLITGDTNAIDRISFANKFNASNEVKIFLVSLKAGGTGLNLVGADTVIHLDPWWNQAAMDQATDRAYRIGQTKNVEVIKLICQNSIEERVIELQNKKKDLFDRVISSNDEAIINAKLEDIAFILK